MLDDKLVLFSVEMNVIVKKSKNFEYGIFFGFVLLPLRVIIYRSKKEPDVSGERRKRNENDH